MAGLTWMSRWSDMEGVKTETNFYTMSNESVVVVGPVVVVGDNFSRLTWSRRRCCLCWCSSQALKTISPHSKLISTVIPRRM